MPIEFSHLGYVYNPKTKIATVALEDISAVIEEGSFTALIGRTGCGKSTLIQQINALLTPTSGEVTVDEYVNSSEKKKRTKKLWKVKKEVGIVFQFSEAQLFEETVEKDVMFAPKNFGMKEEEAKKAAHEALAKVGLGEEFYSRSPFELSGGEKRRVAIAGVLAYKPKYLILDEPTAGLDPNGAKAMMALLKEINASGTTILVVTHDMDIVLGYAEKAIVLDEGKIARIAKPNELFEEDLERFSLQTPAIFAFSKILNERGFALDYTSIGTVEELAKQIASKRGKGE